MFSIHWIFAIYLSVIGTTSESTELNHIRISRELKASGCKLPPYPANGKWSIYEETSTYHPGQTAKHRSIIQVVCNDNFILNGDATIVCINGKFTSDVGECLRTCPPRYRTAIMTVHCRTDERTLENCENPTDGTKARFQCADFYEDRALERNPVHVCFNGKWNHKLPECTPICGQKSITDKPTLIVNGTIATKGDYPWQVALYNATNKEQLCGGSLLNQRVILTAAHCITTDEGNMISKDVYLVAVGKYYRDFNHPDDRDLAQISEIHDMYVPRQYRGEIQNYFGDMAIIVTKNTFRLSTRVQPVCVDWALSRFSKHVNIKQTTHGYVSGWGYTLEHKNPSNVLKELQVPIIGDTDCSKNIPEDYQRYITDDKLCAGFTEQGTSVCRGDSGGGLVVGHEGRYYIIGVVSLAPQAATPEGGCDSQNYGLYTKVQYYVENFILDKEALFKPDIVSDDCNDDPYCKSPTVTTSTTTTTTTTTTTLKPATETPTGSCILPDHPKSGQWSVYGFPSSLSPGQTVSSGTIIQITCNKKLILSGSNLVVCEKGKWSVEFGQCLRTCPPLTSTESTEIICSFENNELDDCSRPLHGTIAKQRCAPYYEDLQLDKNPIRVCRNGSWDISRAECAPVCGLKAVTAEPLIVNGNTAKEGEYPWQVAIYRNQKKQFICAGTLISPKLIVTAAHCVTNWEGKQLKENYAVAVGKFYREYYDPLDREPQFSEVEDIFVSAEYTGLKTNYVGDIAVIVTKKTFKLSKRVQLVCVDWAQKFAAHSSNTTGFAAGWGFTRPESHPADNIQDLEVPIISTKECVKDLPDNFQTFATYGTFCGGYLNQNKSLCSGDAGGSLVTKHEGRYYLTGIISTSPGLPNGGCDSNQYTVYTNVSNYIGFLLENDAKQKGKSPSAPADTESSSPTTTPKTPTQPEPERTTCILPDHPEFGKWAVYGASSTNFKPKSSVVTGTVLQVTCFRSYKLDGDEIVLCELGKWSSTIGKCLRTCSAVRSTSNMKARCIINNKEIENCTHPTDGTIAKYECAPFYEDPKLAQSPLHVCRDGSWSHSRPECLPVCGQRSITPQILIINGNPTKKTEYPWHVGIYHKQKDFICSGVLISRKIILTVAQCVSDHEDKPRPKQDFTVAVGKNFRQLNDSRDSSKHVQISKLEEIFIHSRYRGIITSNSDNIAILVTTKRLTLSPTVQPVCVDYGKSFETKSNNVTGYVTGWGYTAVDENPADQLQELEVPIVNIQTCEQELPDNFRRFLTYDKFCAGYRNQGKSVCKGDSGGGLVSKFNGRYYLMGLVESAPPSGTGCDSQQYSLYVKISKHLDDFIIEKVYEYRHSQ